MLRVTVMMFSDIVESVMLLKEEACNHTHRTFNLSIATSKHPRASLPSGHYPLQTWGALFPPASVAFEEPGGCALLRGTAEPATSSIRWKRR